MYRNPGLALWAAVLLFAASTARAQEPARLMPLGLSAVEIPARLIAARGDLMLSPQQVRSLNTLSAELQREATLYRVSSKPWITAARFTSPSQAYTRAVGLLDSAQRPRAAELLGRTWNRTK